MASMLSPNGNVEKHRRYRKQPSAYRQFTIVLTIVTNYNIHQGHFVYHYYFQFVSKSTILDANFLQAIRPSQHPTNGNKPLKDKHLKTNY